MWRKRRQEEPSGGRMNHNVKLALWWSLCENCSASVRSGDVLSALLYLLTKSNTTVGIVQGINGVLQMLAALPAGYWADRHRRDTMLKAGAAVGGLAGGVLAWALARAPTVWMLGAASALLGCYRGIYSAALEALWADSIQSGRSSLYTKRYALTVVASSFGPWLSLALFHLLGNQWHADDCRLVLGSGLVIMVPPLCLMCLFDDDKTLETQQGRQAAGQQAQQRQAARQQGGQQQQEGAQQGEQQGGQQQQGEQQRLGYEQLADGPAAHTNGALTAGGEAEDGGLEEPLLPPIRAAAISRTSAGSIGSLPLAAAPATPAASSLAAGEAPSDGDLLSLAELEAGGGGGAGGGAAQAKLPGGARRPGWRSRLAPGLVVTLLISFSDFVGALASGMTLKFFALWFMQDVGLRPMAVSLIGALSPLGVAAASLACQPLSKLVGRVQISLFTRCLDILLLVTLAYLPAGPASSAHVLLVSVHLLRMAVANATRPLMRSVLMDCVPRRHRGKVNAVDSVRTFSWSGSAALGGFLVEKIGFQNTFLVTAAIKLLAFVPLFPLLAYVPDGICVPAGARAERLLRQQQWGAGEGAEGSAAAGAVAAAATAAGEPAAARCDAPPASVVVDRGSAGEEEGLRQPLLGDKP